MLPVQSEETVGFKDFDQTISKSRKLTTGSFTYIGG